MRDCIIKFLLALLFCASTIISNASTPRLSPSPYGHLREALENFYGPELATEFIACANCNHQQIKKYLNGTLSPELIEAWFIYQLIKMSPEERDQYFKTRQKTLRAISKTKPTFATMEQIKIKVENCEIPWRIESILRKINLIKSMPAADETDSDPIND